MISKYFIFIVLCFLLSCSADKPSVEYRHSNLPLDSVLTIGTFNIAWLGDGINDRILRADSVYENIANIIIQLEVDILALQEIENLQAIQKLLLHLDNFDSWMIDTEASQDNAFLVKKDILVDDLLIYTPISVLEGKTRPGLILKGNKAGMSFEIMSVHLKSTSRYDDTPEKRQLSYKLRTDQAKILAEYIDSLSLNNNKNFIVVGDFNDNPLRKSTNIKVLQNKLHFLTDSLESCKNKNWDMIDHIALGSNLKNRYLRQSLFVFDIYSSLDSQTAATISDHCPVVASFWLGAQ